MTSRASTDLITVAEAARILGMSRPGVRKLADRGDLPEMRATRGQHQWRMFRRVDVERLARDRIPQGGRR